MADAIDINAARTQNPIAGVRELAERYDAFLVDSYGVLHDGNTLFPGAAECMEQLRATGHGVGILTNTPRRAATVAREIEKIGIAPRHYDFLVSAGEVTFEMLATRNAQLGLPSDARVYYLGPPRSRELLTGLPFAEAVGIEDASFVLITGLVPGKDKIADYGELLAAARTRDLPAICANPDLVAIRSGERGGCAGTIAAAYQVLGGSVRYFGKPFPEIYEMALGRLCGTPASRVLCVGDALHTDIGGAQDFGLDCLFVAGGIHHDELQSAGATNPVGTLFTRNNRRFPTASIAQFRW
jgi:HAD superfamily hydrolase (TIGR01459 family)